jgi:hypothetical protein
MALSEQILEVAAQLPEGTPLAAKTLLHLGGRVAVDQALSRLVRQGMLMRAGRGLYVRPIETRFGKRPPAIPKVLDAIGVLKGEVLAPHGAAAANSLGLTTQVPSATVYLTSGRSRRLALGKQTVELRHAPSWQLAFPSSRIGQALRALAWFGRERASEAVQALRGKLSKAELQELANARARLPTWVASQISVLAYG